MKRDKKKYFLEQEREKRKMLRKEKCVNENKTSKEWKKEFKSSYNEKFKK